MLVCFAGARQPGTHYEVFLIHSMAVDLRRLSSSSSQLQSAVVVAVKAAATLRTAESSRSAQTVATARAQKGVQVVEPHPPAYAHATLKLVYLLNYDE